MVQEVDIKNFSIEQLKSIAYDLVVEKSKVEHNLLIVQREIELKSKQVISTEEENDGPDNN